MVTGGHCICHLHMERKSKNGLGHSSDEKKKKKPQGGTFFMRLCTQVPSLYRNGVSPLGNSVGLSLWGPHHADLLAGPTASCDLWV